MVVGTCTSSMVMITEKTVAIVTNSNQILDKKTARGRFLDVSKR